jgi:hypothetical protein
VTKYTVKIGTELTIEGYQAKEASNKAVGRNFFWRWNPAFLSLSSAFWRSLGNKVKILKKNRGTDTNFATKWGVCPRFFPPILLFRRR